MCFFPIAVHENQPSRTLSLTLDDHSKVDPLLPIPNRTVKRLRADDSGLPVCESRSSSGSYPPKPQHPYVLGFCLFWVPIYAPPPFWRRVAAVSDTLREPGIGSDSGYSPAAGSIIGVLAARRRDTANDHSGV